MRVNWPNPTFFEGLSDVVLCEGLGPDIRKCAEKCRDAKVSTASPRRVGNSPSIVVLLGLEKDDVQWLQKVACMRR